MEDESGKSRKIVSPSYTVFIAGELQTAKVPEELEKENLTN